MELLVPGECGIQDLWIGEMVYWYIGILVY